MNIIFSYDFLKLEFKDIYQDIEELKKETTDDGIEGNINILIDDIIYYIYKKNNILYNEKIKWDKRLKVLKDINIISNEILDMIMLLGKESKANTSKVGESENSKMRILYEVLVWFVVNYGEENYSLILDNLISPQKEIFVKYLSGNKEKIIKGEIENKNGELEEKDDIIRQLVEKGENYYFGRGVKRDNNKAYRYFLDAAKYKNEYAEAYLGLFYEKGIAVRKNYEIAYQWYYKAAVKGNAFAQYSLGVLYSEGNGVNKDYNKAFIWFQKSAENDYVGAYYQLGRAYYNGLGVEKDEEKSFKWHKKAAENNLPDSQYALSLMYKNGDGCEENLVSAYYWVEKAAENDYEDAYYIIGRSYLEGICVDINYKRAFHYLSKGYLALDTNCIESLAEMYLKGLYVKKDIYTAIELYTKAIEFGDKSVYFKLGKVYEDEGLINQSILIYKQGHEEGDLKCTQRLGIIYYNGEGVEKDLEKAMDYMEIAAAKKEPHAMYVLAVAYYSLNKFGDKTGDVAKALLKEAYELGSPYAADYLAYIIINELKDGKNINRNELVTYIKFGVENNLKESIFKYGYI
ncbi:tetratricopeptide repeat protein, partial [uncultured Clostridium sp.]